MSERLSRLLQCELPIQLAPMGSVAASPRLPLAVAAAGGHAMYPGLALPPAALAPVVDALAERRRAFGVNFIVPLMDEAALAMVASRAPYVDFFLADPDPGRRRDPRPAIRCPATLARVHGRDRRDAVLCRPVGRRGPRDRSCGRDRGRAGRRPARQVAAQAI